MDRQNYIMGSEFKVLFKLTFLLFVSWHIDTPKLNAQQFFASIYCGAAINPQSKVELFNNAYSTMNSTNENIGIELGYSPKANPRISFILRTGYSKFGRVSSLKGGIFFIPEFKIHKRITHFNTFETSAGTRFKVIDVKKFGLEVGIHFNYIILDTSPFVGMSSGTYIEPRTDGSDRIITYTIFDNHVEEYSFGPKFDILYTLNINNSFTLFAYTGGYLGLNHVINSKMSYEFYSRGQHFIIDSDIYTVNNLDYINFGLGLKFDF